MFCKECGKEIEENNKFCSNCGTNTETKTNNLKDDIDTFNNTVDVSNNMQKKSTPKSKKKTNTSSGICAIVIVFILFLIVSFTVIPMQNEIKKETELREMIEQYVVSYDDFDKTIKDCGFNDYTIERVEAEDNYEVENSQCFTVQSGNILAYLYTKDNSIYSIQYANEYLYKDGQILHTLSEYTMTSSERNLIIDKTKSAISSILKSPSTAKYPWYDEWKVGKENGIIIVQSYVDSQNSFGATIRNNFQVKIKDNQVTSLILDNEEYIKQ